MVTNPLCYDFTFCRTSWIEHPIVFEQLSTLGVTNLVHFLGMCSNFSHPESLSYVGPLQSGQPLSAEQVFEDVMQDYAKQTVTMELHPHLPSHHASVHPCKVYPNYQLTVFISGDGS